MNSKFEGGFEIQSVKIVSAEKGKISETNVTNIISDTRMQLRLPSPLAANGGTIQFKIDYSYFIPKYGMTERVFRIQKMGKYMQ